MLEQGDTISSWEAADQGVPVQEEERRAGIQVRSDWSPKAAVVVEVRMIFKGVRAAVVEAGRAEGTTTTEEAEERETREETAADQVGLPPAAAGAQEATVTIRRPRTPGATEVRAGLFPFQAIR